MFVVRGSVVNIIYVILFEIFLEMRGTYFVTEKPGDKYKNGLNINI